MRGSIHVITGPMYSGKTNELIRLANRARVSNSSVSVFYPDLEGVEVKSRDGGSLEGSPLPIHLSYDQFFSTLEYLLYSSAPEVVVIEEAQFFSPELTKAIVHLARDWKIQFIVSGLTRTYDGKGFGCMPSLLVEADYITRLSAICTKCRGDGASITVRVDNDKSLIRIGSDGYEARCPACV
jgi:thymidine kinase